MLATAALTSTYSLVAVLLVAGVRKMRITLRRPRKPRGAFLGFVGTVELTLAIWILSSYETDLALFALMVLACSFVTYQVVEPNDANCDCFGDGNGGTPKPLRISRALYLLLCPLFPLAVTATRSPAALSLMASLLMGSVIGVALTSPSALLRRSPHRDEGSLRGV
jgi:hypothetical protein